MRNICDPANNEKENPECNPGGAICLGLLGVYAFDRTNMLLGFAAGIGAGMFGVGGGLLFVPTLIALGLGQVEAEATSLLAIIPTVLAGAWQQQRYGNVRWRAALVLGLSAIAGVEAPCLANLDEGHLPAAPDHFTTNEPMGAGVLCVEAEGARYTLKQPRLRGAILTVIKNPFAGRYVEDIQPFMKPLEQLGVGKVLHGDNQQLFGGMGLGHAVPTTRTRSGSILG